ncbi:unnamed protein product, partial [Didymodactylos carnosus]
VLVDYHNGLLDIIENDNSIRNSIVLQNLVNSLTQKEVSIIQIARDSKGVISLSDQDFKQIEQIARASLISVDKQDKNEYTQLNFDFIYVQSYIIRNYLLLSRINYKHVHKIYQCYIQKKETDVSTTVASSYVGQDFNIPIDQEKLENEWNYLTEMMLDKLYNSLSTIKHISFMLKDQLNQQQQHDNKIDLSKMYLYEFVEQYSLSEEQEQLNECKIKNFQL